MDMTRRDFLALLVVLIAAGCGSGCDAEHVVSSPQPIDSSTGGTDSNSDAVSTSTMSQDIYEEKITIAVNESYVAEYPNWKELLQKAVEYVNGILSRNEGNKKKFAIGKFTAYLEEDIQKIYNGGIENPKYIYDNGYPNCFGTTVVLFFYTKNNRPEIFNAVGNFHRTRTFSGGKRLEEVWLACNILDSPFSELSLEGGEVEEERYERLLKSLIHELGHSFGLAYEELKRYFFEDVSGVLPTLPGHYPWFEYLDILNDPMFNNIVPLRFSNFYSWLLNYNAAHSFTGEQLEASIPESINVKVVDSNGCPASGAEVKVFAGTWGDLQDGIFVADPILLLETTTNEDGNAVINGDDYWKTSYKGKTFQHKFSVKVAAKIIKASFGNKCAGRYLTLYDLEKACLQDGQSSYTVEMQLEWPLPS